MVFYLKYRPKRINELDSIAIQERLSGALKGKFPDDIAHAFLFTGPKGLGKTSTARIVAKAINCKVNNSEIARNRKDDFDDSKTLDRLAKQMIVSRCDQESNFNGLGNVKEVDKDEKETDKTIDLLSKLND